MKLVLPFLFLVLVFLSNCNQTPKNKTSALNTSSIDSIQIIRRPYKNSNVIEYEIPVLKSTKTKHGIQKRYYSHGSLYSQIPYLNGKREGTAFTYYQAIEGVKPAVWKEQPYVNNMLHGVCRRYHKNGKLQAEYEYKEGNPGMGMKEFTQTGKPIKQPTLVLTSNKVATGYYISARLSNNQKNVDYFMGKLDDGKFLPNGLKELQVKSGLGEVVVSGSETMVTISAVYITRYRNKCLVSKTIKL